MVSAVAPVGEFRCIQKRAPLFTDQYLGLYLAVGLAALGTASSFAAGHLGAFTRGLWSRMALLTMSYWMVGAVSGIDKVLRSIPPVSTRRHCNDVGVAGIPIAPFLA